MLPEEIAEELTKARDEIVSLKGRLNLLEQSNVLQRRLPETNLLSDSFLTRAFAVMGHYLVAGLIVAIPFYILFFAIVALIASISR
jgi:hypothetical protein